MVVLDLCGRQDGFSLIELMTTLAIAGIGLSLAVPGVQNLMADNRRAAAINELVGDLHLARSAAITRNKAVVVCPSASGDACDDGEWQDGWIQFADADRNRQVDAEDVILGTSAGAANLEIESAEFEHMLVYAPSGHLLAEPREEPGGAFIFCDPRGPAFATRLVIPATGKPRLDQRDIEPSTSPCEAV